MPGFGAIITLLAPLPEDHPILKKPPSIALKWKLLAGVVGAIAAAWNDNSIKIVA
jgi:hypothetical protein